MGDQKNQSKTARAASKALKVRTQNRSGKHQCCARKMPAALKRLLTHPASLERLEGCAGVRHVLAPSQGFITDAERGARYASALCTLVEVKAGLKADFAVLERVGSLVSSCGGRLERAAGARCHTFLGRSVSVPFGAGAGVVEAVYPDSDDCTWRLERDFERDVTGSAFSLKRLDFHRRLCVFRLGGVTETIAAFERFERADAAKFERERVAAVAP